MYTLDDFLIGSTVMPIKPFDQVVGTVLAKHVISSVLEIEIATIKWRTPGVINISTVSIEFLRPRRTNPKQIIDC